MIGLNDVEAVQNSQILFKNRWGYTLWVGCKYFLLNLLGVISYKAPTSLERIYFLGYTSKTTLDFTHKYVVVSLYIKSKNFTLTYCCLLHSALFSYVSNNLTIIRNQIACNQQSQSPFLRIYAVKDFLLCNRWQKLMKLWQELLTLVKMM